MHIFLLFVMIFLFSNLIPSWFNNHSVPQIQRSLGLFSSTEVIQCIEYLSIDLHIYYLVHIYKTYFTTPTSA
jgi:hypothetical protein